MSTIPLLYCLGRFHLEWQGQSIALPTRKMAALLAYLVYHPEIHSRTRLVTLFWGDFGEEEARRSLRTALSALRKGLGDTCLLADRETVQFNPDFPIWMDAYALRTQARHFLEQPTPDPTLVDVNLYQGDLLTGMDDEWILREREALRLLYLQVLLRLAQHWRTQGDYPQTMTMAQRILTLEPAEEAAHQLLIFCYMAISNRQAAHRQYEACVRTLREELDVEPSPDTVMLYRRSQRLPARAPVSAMVQTNLPLPLSSFIGRQYEISRLKALLLGEYRAGERQPSRLVTVTGPGGCGKTRLAIQVARELLDLYADGVWWVELAALREETQVPQAIAAVFGVEQGVQLSLTAALVNYLRSQHFLLVLDNCEHLIATCTTLVEHLLNYCPELQILVTSREALGIFGEVSWLVPSLTLPTGQPSLPTEYLQFEAVRLFVERASAAQRDFALTTANAPVVRQICAQLDGIPLAIEIAAAQSKFLTVEQLATQLRSTPYAHFDTLTTGGRSLLPRQQTLRATIEWSYRLLSEQEQGLLQQVAVFVGGWSLEAAQMVGAEGGQAAVPALLARLVDKSLVLAEPQGAVMRYRILETIRQYAYAQLEKSGEEGVVRDRHLAYFLHLAAQAEPEFRGGGQLTWLRCLDTDYENLRAALRWGLQHEATITRLIDGATLATALIFYWKLHGDWFEGYYWLQIVAQLRVESLQIVDAECLHRVTILRAKALYGAGVIAWHQRKLEEASQMFDASVAIWRAVGNQTGRYCAQLYQADLCLDERNPTVAIGLLHECLAHFRQIQDPWNLAHTLFFLGYSERRVDNDDAATRYYQECSSLLQGLGERWLWSLATSHLGLIACDQGDYATAWTQIEQRLQMGREFDMKQHIYTALQFLALIATKQGDVRRAASLLQEVLRIKCKAGVDLCTSLVDEILCPIALVCAMDGHKERAVRLFAANHSFASMIGWAALETDNNYKACVTELRTQLGETAFMSAWAAGQILTLEQAFEEALRKS